ncbi:50S ribosomal protein L6 [Candidatus Woesebacteria bacterium RIFCSPHIGHO2_02_FULL_38_9]|uniref:50S ribosomal protein L6 n=1 Tax=Candidatus Woesebacteria bacterium RIFCSPHIGHO2_01_FULL_39_28 TaxID=1802496 RepID=A0A1F7YA74_9BACT|nr:MAG: 50S ribosomal protein L6 [Candidatus Woesebacteria bacterium RIFCSPHIGHO2_01_FULL_39_28]OGM32238.1 MAG: 50S ribosomal protein L6 [Candidatus Woesebacteria bacterium RIFCSPHIGHO2_02_FULL_38_9]OGM58461.1 MAG: 50S ribosomal protein L6 [Candidatus Woesebacteria bacterium RIFCSPLOWO2_01_FULL_38_20]
MKKQLSIEIPKEVQVTVQDQVVKVVGPYGELTRKLPLQLEVNVGVKEVSIKNRGSNKASLANVGTINAHIKNMFHGVTSEWKKTLELVGAGYRAEVKDGSLVINIGFSHPVTFLAPSGIKFKVEKSLITIEGPDIEIVGLLAARIRAIRPPDPYKGKGIRYQNEILKLKPGKQAAKTEGAK